MFILILRTCVIAGVLQSAGTTLQVADSFIIDDKVRQVAAPVVPAPAPVAVAPVVNPPEGSIRARVPIQIANMILQPGGILPPGSLNPTTTRTRVASSGGKKGKEESLVEIFHNGQWQLVQVDS